MSKVKYWICNLAKCLVVPSKNGLHFWFDSARPKLPTHSNLPQKVLIVFLA